MRDIEDSALVGGECVAGGIALVSYNTTTGRAQLLNPKISTSQVFFIKEEQNASVAGGTIDNTFPTRTLNVVIENSITGASLSSNQITLPAGTYRVEGSFPAYSCNRHQSRLRNITDSTTELEGTSGYSDNTNNGYSDSDIVGNFTIASSKVFEVQHGSSATQATNGLGNPANLLTSEIYGRIKLVKL